MLQPVASRFAQKAFAVRRVRIRGNYGVVAGLLVGTSADGIVTVSSFRSLWSGLLYNRNSVEPGRIQAAS